MLIVSRHRRRPSRDDIITRARARGIIGRKIFFAHQAVHRARVRARNERVSRDVGSNYDNGPWLNVIFFL